mmetsp:Transcript_22091/g.33270  ORF Transcript_22091/g.33270 Transcript_22091/m.33270 type:complete len:323 (-) Transcript_22091:96-1064(-)
MSTNTKKRGLSPAAPNVDPTAAGAAAAAAIDKPAKKPRKKAVTAKSLGLTKDEFESIKAAPIKRTLKDIVKKLAKQVDEDWHDGYEDQAETKGEWFEAIQEPLQAVLDIGVGKKTALLQCNEVLKIVSDSFYDLLACPCRCDTKDELDEMDRSFELQLPWGETDYTATSGYQQDVWSYVWVALLRVHSNLDNVDEGLLLQCIKDANDNMSGAKMIKLPGYLYDQSDEQYDIDTYEQRDGKNAPSGTKLAHYVNDRASEWKSLPTTKKVHRMRRAIDRRFDGTPERRTRDYHLHDSDDDDSYGRGYGYGGGGYGRAQRDCIIS